MITKRHMASAIVLGLNDAIVEIAGSLSGLTFALDNAKLIGLSGLIIGVAAALSMAASEFLSEEEDGENKKESKHLAYLTGITYILVVILLVIPYFIITNVIYALIGMLLVALAVILVYSYHMAKLENQNFWKKFKNMTILSMGVSFISFILGYILNYYFGINV